MPTTKRTLDELAALGGEIFDRIVRPALRAEDDGKFVAIDVETGDYEMNEDDYSAVMRLRSRKPAADVWLMRAGYPAIDFADPQDEVFVIGHAGCLDFFRVICDGSRREVEIEVTPAFPGQVS